MGMDEPTTDPELAKYLNRSYWEQRKMTESPTSMISPTAPSPSISIASSHPQTINIPQTAADVEIDEFSASMKTQVEMFVNRMKSNSSRGRNICNDSSVQTLFMNLTALHSQLLTYIKETDDKRMWYEQLQDKLAQVKDSRAALDVLRQEHVEKLRRIAEEQERQRQMQMAQKLEIMRKKKQEYLQYQREVALQRIQEQEREMQMRQEMQMAQYRMGQTAFPFGSPNHQIGQPAGYQSMPPYGQPQPHEMPQQAMSGYYGNYGPGSLGPISPLPGQLKDGQQFMSPGHQFMPPTTLSEHGPQPNGQMQHSPFQPQLGHHLNHPGLPSNQQVQNTQPQPMAPAQTQGMNLPPPQQQQGMAPPQPQQGIPLQQGMGPPHSQIPMNQQQMPPSQPPQQHQSQHIPPQQSAPTAAPVHSQPQAVAPPPEPEPAKKVEEENTEVQTAELISFD